MCPYLRASLYNTIGGIDQESIVEIRQYLWFLSGIAEEQTLQSASIRCKTALEKFNDGSDYSYLYFDKHGGALIGSVGLHRTDWTVPKTEVGYWIRKNALGCGYATESVTALTSWALNDMQAARISLITDAGNIASCTVAERCGFLLGGIHRNMNVDPNGVIRHECMYAKYST